MEGKTRAFSLLFLVLALGTLFPLAAQQAPPLDLKAIFDHKYENWIRTHPDQFSWMILALISQQAPESLQFTLKDGTKTNNVVWETWADDDFTFPSSPDPAKPPQWSDRICDLKRGLHLAPDPLATPGAHAPEMSAMVSKLAPLPPRPDINPEEVRRNKTSFDFISSQHLWYQEGIAQWTQDHPRKEMSFPRGAVEIKAYWLPLGPPQNNPEPYHWNTDGDGTTYALVGLHIMTNAVPEWTWATFEYDLTPDQCKGPGGCTDRYGCEPYASCIRTMVDAPQSKIHVSAGVSTMFAQLGVRDEWRNYRLHGAQTLSHNRPKPTLLWNSWIERDFKPTSSCIACHARATVDVKGKPDCTLGKINACTGRVDYPPYDPPLPQGVTTTSFIWAFIKAHPAHSDTPVCAAPQVPKCPTQQFSPAAK